MTAFRLFISRSVKNLSSTKLVAALSDLLCSFDYFITCAVTKMTADAECGVQWNFSNTKYTEIRRILTIIFVMCYYKVTEISKRSQEYFQVLQWDGKEFTWMRHCGKQVKMQ